MLGQSPAPDPSSPSTISQLEAKAQAGDPGAQVALGKAYEAGRGVPQSYALAMKWYRTAAEQGNAIAENDVGLMFRLGRGVEQDKVEAVKWYRKAAKKENLNAMYNIGTAYYNGDGVGADMVSAYAWFLLAEKVGNPAAINATKQMKEETGTLECDAFEKIGDMYQKGDELGQNSSEAINWYRKAAENGKPEVQIKLANLLFHGEHASANYEEVHRLCEKAANLHFPPGAYCMGRLYPR
jgi:TPR repeat protein